MAESLRDQLLKSGIVKQVREDKRAQSRAEDRGGARRDGAGKRQKRQGAGKGEMDLARAYAIRAQSEAEERKRVQAEAEARARERKERKRRLDEALEGKTMNKADADLLRHFEYGGKIRRVHVDAAQMAALNAGQLGVVQHGGRYLLVSREAAEAVRGFAPDHVALLVDAGTDAADDGVPDDLVW